MHLRSLLMALPRFLLETACRSDSLSTQPVKFSSLQFLGYQAYVTRNYISELPFQMCWIENSRVIFRCVIGV